MISRYKGIYEEQVHSRLIFMSTSESVPNQLTGALHSSLMGIAFFLEI